MRTLVKTPSFFVNKPGKISYVNNPVFMKYRSLLAKIFSFKFNGRFCLKTMRSKVIREDSESPPLGLCKPKCSHTYACLLYVHTHMPHTHMKNEF